MSTKMPKIAKRRPGRPMTDSPLGRLAEAMGGLDKLADRIGVSRSTASRWVRGEVEPRRAERVLLSVLAAEHGVVFDGEATS